MEVFRPNRVHGETEGARAEKQTLGKTLHSVHLAEEPPKIERLMKQLGAFWIR